MKSQTSQKKYSRSRLHQQRGFTIIELLTVMGLMGVLASTSLSTFHSLKDRSYIAVTQQTVRDSKTALSAALLELSLEDTDSINTVLNMPGIPSGQDVVRLLPGFRMPQGVELTLENNPLCTTTGCVVHSIVANSCPGKRMSLWERYGDGSEVLLQELPSPGCP